MLRFLKTFFGIYFVTSIAPREARSADVILAQSFGQRPRPEDDIVNRELAQVVRTEYAHTHAKIVVQWEIGDHLKDLPVTRIEKHREAGKYLDTREVIDQSKLHAPGNRAIIVAHPDHVWRVVKVAEKLGLKVVGVGDTTHIGYDPNSTQNWTRGPWRFFFYDTIARTIYFVKGWI